VLSYDATVARISWICVICGTALLTAYANGLTAVNNTAQCCVAIPTGCIMHYVVELVHVFTSFFLIAAITNTLGVKLVRLGWNMKNSLVVLFVQLSIINTSDLIP